MLFLHNATIITSEKEAVGSVLIEDGKIKEVPIIFVDRTEGTSKMSSGIFGEAFWGVMKLKMRKIRPRK